MSVLSTKKYKTDLCIIGGGLSGTIAAISAARKGVKVVLIQDRPMLGGNCSSEIRMWVRGAQGYANKEMGILGEMEEENIYRNPYLVPSLWDSVLYGKVKAEPNITLILNASCLAATTKDGVIQDVTAWQLTTYVYHKVEAKYFADCSGDGILAFLTEAKYRIGREANSEYNETIGPKIADTKTMGLSILLQARETDHKVDFIPPKWANVYKTDEDFAAVPQVKKDYALCRDHRIGTNGCNLWWIELGGDSEAITSTEEVRDELLKVVYGIWDHIKNYGDHGCQNWELEWVGFLPGKRESVRYIGEYVLTQNDIEENRDFFDAVAYGGWPMDDHNPKGIKANPNDDVPSVVHPAPSPYQIPYRCLYSANIKNLFFAGRDISATHAAMSSTRVMGTCSLLGQAVGNAAALCVKYQAMPHGITEKHIAELQKEITDDGVFIPRYIRKISSLVLEAKMNISDADKATLCNGIEKTMVKEDKNYVAFPLGDALVMEFKEKTHLATLRLQFDPDYERLSVSKNIKMRTFAQKINRGFDFEPLKVPATIVKSIEVYADGKKIVSITENYNSLLKVNLNLEAKKLEVKFISTWGAKEAILYGCDILNLSSIK